ncbi:hypothetical protein [Cloacibacterium caeni]|uniref:hypothetical protein n=1 Tax=Cloacibacterium caeni TaxID=2004710 RepID=UPI001BD0A719|nr:hypothetical protein [Cloacibacterium caeni]
MKKTLFLLTSVSLIISCDKKETYNDVDSNVTYEQPVVQTKYAVVTVVVESNTAQNVKNRLEEITKRPNSIEPIQLFKSDVMEINEPITEDLKYRLMDEAEQNLLRKMQKDWIVTDRQIFIYNSYSEASSARAEM